MTNKSDPFYPRHRGDGAVKILGLETVAQHVPENHVRRYIPHAHQYRTAYNYCAPKNNRAPISTEGL